MQRMNAIRKIILWAVLAAIGLLAVLSAVGAFLGADRARDLFHSLPLAVCWFLLAALLIAGLAAFRRLLRSPGSLGMHLGALLVLAGALWGSDEAHEVRRAWFGSQKVPSGFMVIYKGESESAVLDRDFREVLAQLPFSLHLKDFRIDYYPSPQEPWGLGAIVPTVDAAGNPAERQVAIPWTVGAEADVPHTPVRLRVLQYLPSAAAAYEAGAEPAVAITTDDGRRVTLAARPGEEADLQDPPLKVRVVRVFENLVVQGAGEDRRVTDSPGEGANAAVEVEVVRPDGTTRTRYLMARMPAHGQGEEGVVMRYVLPEPTGARPDPATGAAAMEVLLKAGGRERRAWLMPEKGVPYAALALAPVLPEGPDAAEAGPVLYLVPPVRDIKTYTSDVVILEEGREAGRAAIQVNHPLHWGGYHFRQASYDIRGERYTVLGVVSDSGLAAVYAGFLLLAAGATWRLWIEPAWSRSKARGAHGD